MRLEAALSHRRREVLIVVVAVVVVVGLAFGGFPDMCVIATCQDQWRSFAVRCLALAIALFILSLVHVFISH